MLIFGKIFGFCRNSTYICSEKYVIIVSMISTTQFILAYAEQNSPFRISELMQSLPVAQKVSESSVTSTISRLIATHRLARISRGVYTKIVDHKNHFNVVLGEMEHEVNLLLKKQFPLATFCIYNGQTFAPLQHHLSYNTITYVETEREVTEATFNFLRDRGFSVFLNPNEDVTSLYIDLKQQSVIVKPLVPESPLDKHDGFIVPTLEKLLIDIRKDPDFSYLQDIESDYMLENAKALYPINTSRLARYARRRSVSIQIETIE